jgi:hypothetical protein
LGCTNGICSNTSGCAHSPCVSGGPLSTSCTDQCVMFVCTFSATCCSSSWDATCVSLYTQLCPSSCAP